MNGVVDGKNHYGRYQFVRSVRTPDAVELVIEAMGVSAESFSVPIVNDLDKETYPVGYLQFKKAGEGIFQLVGVRQGHGAILVQRASEPDAA